MTGVREYILQIVTVCFLCCTVIHLTKGLKASGELIKVLCGILMAVTVFTPIVQLRWNDLSGYLERMKEDAQITAAEGTLIFNKQRNESIQQQLQTYILDKAAAYGCELTVQVELSQEDPPVPVKVTLQGNISPYQKSQLSNIIDAELGIQKEMQTWNAIN